MTTDFENKRSSTTLQDAIINIDRDILRLLARRTNMLHKLMPRNTNHLDAQSEKAIRSAWEKYAQRMSNDVRLTRHLFSLLQEIEFLPKPQEGEERRPSFNLAPVRRAVDVHITAPLVSRRSRLFLTLAAVSGQGCRIRPSMLGDTDISCIKMFNQLGTSLAWDDDGTLRARQGGGITLADKVVFAGNDILNFYLALGQFVGHPSHVKFSGDADLKLHNTTPIRHFLTQLGARLTNVVPGSDGLPVRLECSGMTPDTLHIPADLPDEAVIGLIWGAVFWPHEVVMDLEAHPHAAQILEETGSILRACAANIQIQEAHIRIQPGPLQIPETPQLGMELSLAAYLLALPAAAGGSVQLDGFWPDCDTAAGVAALLQQGGVKFNKISQSVTTSNAQELPTTRLSAALDALGLPAHFSPLALALSVLAALRGGSAPAPNLAESIDFADVESFCEQTGVCIENDVLRPSGQKIIDEIGWTAPSPYWILALSLVAYARPHTRITNPGLVTTLYPAFWSLYNALPCPELKTAPTETEHEKPVRRRIIAANNTSPDSGDTDN